MATDARTKLLEDVALRARDYLETARVFYMREMSEGRGSDHLISPRLGNAYKDLQDAVYALDTHEVDHA